MERDSLIAAMKASISKVLETMFFCPVVFPDTFKSDVLLFLDNGRIIATKIDFRGPFSGSFFLIIPEILATGFTAAFLGEDEKDISHKYVDETPKEIINMIAGCTFTFFDDLAQFELGIPEKVGFDEVGYPFGLEDEIVIKIDTLGGSLFLMMVNSN